jgi:hypothetical protein
MWCIRPVRILGAAVAFTAIVVTAGGALASPAHTASGHQVQASSSARPAAASGPARQAWVWHPPAAQTLVPATRGYGVTQLLVWVSPGFSHNASTIAYLRGLRQVANAHGQTLTALCGDPSWAQTPGVAGAWAREVNATNMFAGLHLDIEPHALPAWQTKRESLAEGLLKALRAVKSGVRLPVAADIPYWYNTVPAGDGQSLDVAVMRAVDSVTLMSYRNHASDVLSISGPEMAHAASLHKPAFIGISVAPPGSDPPTTTYFGSKAATVATDLVAIDRGARQWRSYAGTAVNDAEDLLNLR